MTQARTGFRDRVMVEVVVHKHPEVSGDASTKEEPKEESKDDSEKSEEKESTSQGFENTEESNI